MFRKAQQLVLYGRIQEEEEFVMVHVPEVWVLE